MLYDYIKKRMLYYPEQRISDGVTTLTYSELLSEAEILGNALLSPKYGILFSSELDTARALLSCLYAKKTAVPLSAKYGQLHIDRIIQTVGLSHILSESGIKQTGISEKKMEDLSDVALILCTSGTTGIPKGAMITEENLLSNLCDIETYFNIGQKDSILIARPIYHCAVLTGEFLISLICGARIVFFSEGFIPNRILNAAQEEQITVLCGTPTLLYHLSKLNMRIRKNLTINTMAISGECMTKNVADIIRSAFPFTDIYNVYGLTEASPRVSFLPPWEFDLYPLSVGRLLPSLQCILQDGELLIKGKSIMKGYYGDKMTTERTIKNGWLHTGDMATIDTDGRLYIKGRKDNLIIRAGMNIYPQEIERAMKVDNRIRDVLVYGIKDSIISEKIVMKVVTSLSKQEVFRICQRVLPEYELPDIIEIVAKLPRNASGKVVRYATRY